MCFHWPWQVNRKGKTKVRYKAREFGNGAAGGFYDDEADLVQNNGRVTLPHSSSGLPLRKSQLKVLIFLGVSIFITLLIGRK